MIFVPCTHESIRLTGRWDKASDRSAKNGTHVHFVNGSDWISPQPLHPLRDGHKTDAENLTPILKGIFGLW